MQARTAGRSFGTPSLLVVELAGVAVEGPRHQPDAARGGEHDAEDERDQPVAAHAQVPEAGQRPEDKESKADEDAARGDEANGLADLVAETLRARRQPERGDRGPAGSGKAVEGRPAGGWTHHGGSPHVAIPLSRGRRPGLAWRRSTCRTCLPRCDAPQTGRASWRGRVLQYVVISVVGITLK